MLYPYLGVLKNYLDTALLRYQSSTFCIRIQFESGYAIKKLSRWTNQLSLKFRKMSEKANSIMTYSGCLSSFKYVSIKGMRNYHKYELSMIRNTEANK